MTSSMGIADPDAARRAELASFVRARRASLQPTDVGLCPSPTRRNTPGLRREEAAQVCGVGITWYTWLEQGRPIATSVSSIDALARGLHLDRDAHAHLRGLADLPMPETERIHGEPCGELHHLLDVVLPAPACVLGERFDFVAWNETFASIWRPETLPPGRRNVIWIAFCDPARRASWVNWEERSRTLLAEFRAAAGRHAGDERFAEMIADIESRSPEFRSWWTTYEVRQSIAGELKIRIPDGGVVNLQVVELRVCSHPSLRLSVHAPVRPPDRKKLGTLARTHLLAPQTRAPVLAAEGDREISMTTRLSRLDTR